MTCRRGPEAMESGRNRTHIQNPGTGQLSWPLSPSPIFLPGDYHRPGIVSAPFCWSRIKPLKLLESLLRRPGRRCHAQLENIISGLLVSEIFLRMLLWLLWCLLTASLLACVGGHQPSHRYGWHFLAKHVLFPRGLRKLFGSHIRGY